jgi:hypothetical protein
MDDLGIFLDQSAEPMEILEAKAGWRCDHDSPVVVDALSGRRAVEE